MVRNFQKTSSENRKIVKIRLFNICIYKKDNNFDHLKFFIRKYYFITMQLSIKVNGKGDEKSFKHQKFNKNSAASVSIKKIHLNSKPIMKVIVLFLVALVASTKVRYFFLLTFSLLIQDNFFF